MTDIETLLCDHAHMIGANGRFFAILVASMHGAGVIDGRAIAQSIRLDIASPEIYRMSVADLINRCIDEGASRATIAALSSSDD